MIDTDTLLELLSDGRRRYILTRLVSAEGSVTGTDLAAELVRLAGSEPHDDELSRVRIGLVHAHLPKLQAAGAIDFDRQRDEIRCTDALRERQPVVAAVTSIERSLTVEA
jgi:hypothetical protein